MMLGWRRLLVTLSASALLGLVLSMHNETATAIVTARAVLVGFVAMLTFGLFEQWPARLPAWLPRWTLQLVGVVLVVPFAGVLAYWVTLGRRSAVRTKPEAYGWLRQC